MQEEKKKKASDLLHSAEHSTEISQIGQDMNLPSISISIIIDAFSFKLEEKKTKIPLNPMYFLWMQKYLKKTLVDNYPSQVIDNKFGGRLHTNSSKWLKILRKLCTSRVCISSMWKSLGMEKKIYEDWLATVQRLTAFITCS